MKMIYTIFFFSQFVQAADLEVAMSNVTPYSYSENGQLKGINYEILRELESKTHLKFNYTLFPHARLLNALTEVNPDIVMLFQNACKRHSLKYEIGPDFYTTTPSIFLKKGVNPNKTDLRIGKIIGTCTALSEAYVKKEHTFDVATMEQALEMVKHDRLDGICAIEDVLSHTQAKATNKKIFTVYKVEKNSEAFKAVLCIKKSLPAQIKTALIETARKLKASGTGHAP